MIRDAKIADFPAILGLNLEMEQYLSPLSEELLSDLRAVAVYHRVIETKQGEVAGFLLALREGADYSSVNYLWFAERYRQFLYVDRVVVAPAHRRKRLGRLLYDDLFAFARENGIAAVACEFDINPPNEASRRFHSRFGFREVGRQWVAGGKKQVSLQMAEVPAKAEPSLRAGDPD
jgi:predicted GNAT superfamily acetyltransferase